MILFKQLAKEPFSLRDILAETIMKKGSKPLIKAFSGSIESRVSEGASNIRGQRETRS